MTLRQSDSDTDYAIALGGLDNAIEMIEALNSVSEEDYVRLQNRAVRLIVAAQQARYRWIK